MVAGLDFGTVVAVVAAVVKMRFVGIVVVSLEVWRIDLRKAKWIIVIN